MNLFNQKKLKEIGTRCAEKIKNAQDGAEFNGSPFKHLVIDDFLPEDLASMCLESFPNEDSDEWEKTFDADIEIKMRSKWQSEFDIPEGIVDTIRLMNSSLILMSIGERFNIPKLVPDAYYTGGGLNATTRGGLLDVHVDGNYHDATGLNRRINAIIYLNKDWKQGWGGEFGLYDKTGDVCLKEVPPLFNRLVVFDTHDFSYHGLPNPLNFPEKNSRKSIILYYYTKESRPSQLVHVDQPHSALWKKRGLKDKKGNETRDFD